MLQTYIMNLFISLCLQYIHLSTDANDSASQSHMMQPFWLFVASTTGIRQSSSQQCHPPCKYFEFNCLS